MSERLKRPSGVEFTIAEGQAGDLTIVQFATAAQVPVEQAKAFLDQKAQVLNASFDVKDTGAIVYRFPL